MKQELLQKYFSHPPRQILRDLLGGVVTAMISIPISMGYAQIAGLPMEYGLYGSVFPILLFGLLTSSRDFVFGVDAAPAALTGAAVASFGFAAASPEAAALVPTISLLTAGWLLLFYFLKAGRVVQYISGPVMSGFVTGICLTIILMQVPKLFGGSAGSGEAPELILHIITQGAGSFHLLSFLLGLATVAVILIGKRFCPKVPLSVVVMVIGAALTPIVRWEELGVRLLPAVSRGFPSSLTLPMLPAVDTLSDLLFSSLSIAAVILSESLLASKGNAMKDGYKLKNNREVLAYAAANAAGALVGCCPTNGSVSRTGIVRQFGVKSQWLSVSAGLCMVVILYAAAPLIAFLPVPILTAIVISALIGACEFKEPVHLFKTCRTEFFIYAAAALGVLLLGTVYGVAVGVLLSFLAVIARAVTPPRAFLGVVRGREGFYPLDRNSEARPVRHTVIYRFGGNLFFANCETFRSDIESALEEDTKVVVVHGGAIGSLDVTAAKQLLLLQEELERRGVRFYLTEHIGEVNDLLRQYGAQRLLQSGCVRMTMELALRDAGMKYPFPAEEETGKASLSPQKRKLLRVNRSSIGEGRLSGRYPGKGIRAELEWALGKDADALKDSLADDLLEALTTMDLTEQAFEAAEKHTRWGRINLFDEDELIDRLELRLYAMARRDPQRSARLEAFLEERRAHIEAKMWRMDPNVLQRLMLHRRHQARELQKKDPAAFAWLQSRRSRYIEVLEKTCPELAEQYRKETNEN